MSNTQTKISKFRIFAVISFTAALFAGFFPGTANAAETPLSMGTASTYAVLASAAVTSATASGVSGSAGGNIGVGGATAPSVNVGTMVNKGVDIQVINRGNFTRAKPGAECGR